MNIAESNMSLLQVKGENAKLFLQGQLTCDVNQINENNASWSGYCDQKGRLFSVFLIFYFQGDYFLWLPKDTATATQQELSKYARLSKVILENVSADFFCYLTQEINSHQQEKLIKQTIVDQDVKINLLNNITIIFAKKSLVLMNQIDQKKFSEELINYGIAKITEETMGLFTPHELNLPNINAVSFTKGCYRGQEIIARMEHLGKLKYVLAKGIMDFSPDLKPGDKIMDAENNKRGTLVNFIDINSSVMVLMVLHQENVSDLLLIHQKKVENIEVFL